MNPCYAWTHGINEFIQNNLPAVVSINQTSGHIATRIISSVAIDTITNIWLFFIKNKIISQFFQISHDFCRTLQVGSDYLFIWPAFWTCVKPTIFMKKIKVVDFFCLSLAIVFWASLLSGNNPVAKSCNSLVFWFMSYTRFGMKVPHLEVLWVFPLFGQSVLVWH